MQSSFFPHCVFHDVTGLNCPGCGATRAFYCLSHGQLIPAVRCNPLLMLFLPLLMWWGGRWAVATVRGDHAPAPLGHAWRGRTIWILVIVVCVYWVARNIPAYPFTLLSPPTTL